MKVQVHSRAKVLLTAFIFFCFSLFLTAYSLKNPALASSGSVLALGIMKPFQSVSYAASSGVSFIWNKYFYLINVQQENEALVLENLELREERAKMLELREENARLREILGMVEETTFEGLVANVIGRDPVGVAHTVTVDKGGKHGVRVGMPVVSGGGVAGQVIASGRYSSKVLLIVDNASGVDVLIQRTRARGVLEGFEGRLGKLRYVSREDEVVAGDTVVTSGMDGVYPKGLPVGTVSQVRTFSNSLFHSIDVRPVLDFRKLENVLILTNSRLDESGEEL